MLLCIYIKDKKKKRKEAFIIALVGKLNGLGGETNIKNLIITVLQI